jgi:hypothetical protein
LDQQDPELTGDKRGTRQHEKRDKFTSRTVFILWPIEGKISAPSRLIFCRPAIRGD